LGREFAHANQTAVTQALQAGVRYTYTIRMPGDITEYNTGRLTDAGLEINVLEQMARAQPLRIKSHTLNWPQMALLLIVALDVLLFVDLVGIWVINAWRARVKAVQEKARLKEEEEMRKRGFPKNKKLSGNEVWKADETHQKLHLGDLPAEWEE
jgi:hypothetical protein